MNCGYPKNQEYFNTERELYKNKTIKIVIWIALGNTFSKLLRILNEEKL